jgi:hypothetical protein
MRRREGLRRLLWWNRRPTCPECGYRAPGHEEACGLRLVEQARERMMAADPRF